MSDAEACGCVISRVDLEGGIEHKWIGTPCRDHEGRALNQWIEIDHYVRAQLDRELEAFLFDGRPPPIARAR